MILVNILLLYLAFRAKQVICDFFLQTGWLALTKEATQTREGWKALAIHAGIHAAFTFMLVVVFAPSCGGSVLSISLSMLPLTAPKP